MDQARPAALAQVAHPARSEEQDTMPFDPSNLSTGGTFPVQPQAGPVQPQGGTWTATPIDEHFDLDDPLPDFCLQLRDLEQGHPP